MDNTTKNLSIFTGIIEENLEYTLKLVSVPEEPAVNKIYHGKLIKLKTEIKDSLSNAPICEVIRITAFITLLETIYNAVEEIKQNIKELVKYPPVNLDLSEVSINISGIIKKAIDGFLTGDSDSGLTLPLLKNR